MSDSVTPGFHMIESASGFQWRSQSTFIVVAAGATLSLNDFLTFPALAGQNGGGAFLILYILFLFLFGFAADDGRIVTRTYFSN